MKIGVGVRQQDAAEDLEEARAVDLRRLDQLGRERLVVVAEEQRREAEAVDDVHEHEVDGRIAEAEREAGHIGQRLPICAELAEDHRHRNEHRLERNEAGEQHHAEHELVAGKSPFGQHVAVERAEQSRDQHRRHDHLDRVPEVALDASAVSRRRRRPSPQAFTQGSKVRSCGSAEHVAAGDLVERLQRRHHHDDERHEVDDREQDRAAHRSRRGSSSNGAPARARARR